MVLPLIRKIPNDVANEVAFIAIETTPGVAATTGFFRVNAMPDINTDFSVLDEQDVTGTYVRKANMSMGIPVHTGTWGGSLSYERLPSLARAVIQAGGAPTVSAAPAYTYQQDTELIYDSVNTYTVIYNVAGDYYRATGVRFGEFNIEGSVDGSGGGGTWMYGGSLQMAANDQLPATEVTATGGTVTTVVQTGAGWTVDQFAGAYVFPDRDTNLAGARLISGNTLDTITVTTAFDVAPVAGKLFLISGLPPAGIPALVEEKIRMPGTKLYIDPSSGVLGTTQILQRFIGFNVTWNLNLDSKTFAENTTGASGLYGRGELVVSGQVRIEADRPDEYRQLKAMKELSIRIEQEGTELTAGVRKRTRIDLKRVMWTQRTRDTRNNNKTQTMAFWAYYTIPFARVETRNGLAILP